jgi:mRNA interferase HigB
MVICREVAMEIIGEDTLKAYARKHQNARSSLARWLKITKAANWKNFQEVKATFAATDYIPQSQYCFDIGGNNFRLITAISFQLNTVTILELMTHAEYDKKNLNTR